MASAPPINKIERAHQMYRESQYEEALGFYSEALGMAKTKPQKIALHSNRAACYLKLHDFKKAAEECTSVLELDNNHTGALMLRAQTLVTLKEYHSALFDVNRLMELNPSSEVYRNLHARLKTQLSLAPIPEDETEFEEQSDEQSDNGDENDEQEEVLHVVEKDQVTPLQEEEKDKGWQAIPKPKGHSRLDYSRWDSVEDESSSDDEDDEDYEDSQPKYRFRLRTVGVRSVK
ncbi:protein unc-45 homolog A [Impatiens glandulifera]|uniref:protein unc-45 homolog A n=1 Tax=Impatiens glandulifera TaxID=253017 RepID=UPI001FB0A2B0|nr:protein unc-45 homolog A [Impatiens glandulifera]